MRIPVLLLMVTASSFMPRGGSASGEVAVIEEIKGGVSEVNKFSSPLLALQFTRRGEGEDVNEGFYVMANTVFSDSAKFAEVDLSDPANSEWVDLTEDSKYGFAVPTESDDGYRIIALKDMPESPLELMSYLKTIYVMYVVIPDTEKLGDVEGLRPHQAILQHIDAAIRGSGGSNNNEYVSTSKKASIRVGDTMVRPEELASRDGSTTLSLSGHGSILISGSTACQTGLGVNPAADGVDNDVKEEREEVEIFTANKRKVRKVAEKKAAKGRSGDVKGPLRKFRGFFGHGPTVRGGDSVGPMNKDVKGDQSQDARQGQEEEGGARDGDDGRGGGVPDAESSNRRSENGKGKGSNGWFGWKRWGGGSKVKANLDGEVTMSVSELGSLDVTYDGVNVLSKSGPHAWEWVNRISRFPRGRTRSNDYELSVVQDGIEMCLGQEKLWGGTVRSPCPAPDES